MIYWSESNIFRPMRFVAFLSLIFVICLTSCKSDRSYTVVADEIESGDTLVTDAAYTEEEVENDAIIEEEIAEEIEEEVVYLNQEETGNYQNSDAPSQNSDGSGKSTIAMQQEAARVIDQENRKKASKASGDEKATFKKVINKNDDVVTNPSTNSKPKPTTKPKLKKANKSKKGAEIAFERVIMSFDTITAGDIVNHNFNFVNTGSGPLVINEVTVTCGCMQPGYPFVPIEPDEQGHVAVRYDSTNKSGIQKATITVFTNAGEETQLTMVGFVAEK